MSFFNNKNGQSSPTEFNDETIQRFVATSNQTVFNLTGSYEIGKNRLEVIVGGVRQFAPVNFTETNSRSFTMKIGVPEGVDVVAIYR